ncbi:hypothetical protein LguiB_005969 [Lonicera macranthoides]
MLCKQILKCATKDKMMTIWFMHLDKWCKCKEYFTPLSNAKAVDFALLLALYFHFFELIRWLEYNFSLFNIVYSSHICFLNVLLSFLCVFVLAYLIQGSNYMYISFTTNHYTKSF